MKVTLEKPDDAESETLHDGTSIIPALKRLLIILTARFGRHLCPGVLILAYFSLRFGSVGLQIGAALVLIV